MVILNNPAVGADIDGARLYAVYDGWFDEIEVYYDRRLFMHLTQAQQAAYHAKAKEHVEALRDLLTDAYKMPLMDAAKLQFKCYRELRHAMID